MQQPPNCCRSFLAVELYRFKFSECIWESRSYFKRLPMRSVHRLRPIDNDLEISRNNVFTDVRENRLCKREVWSKRNRSYLRQVAIHGIWTEERVIAMTD